MIFLLIIGFLVVMYVLIYARRYKDIKKNREKSTVQNYRETYVDTPRNIQRRRNAASQGTKHITKYNNSIDYREKDATIR